VELKLAPKTGARTPAEVADLARDCVAAVVSTDVFDASVFERATDLRVVARVGVGTDSVDVDAATRAGVAITTTPGANDGTTADHAVALMLAVLRRVVENDQAVRAGRWSRAGEHTPWELGGRTVGLVGFGSIGRAVARRLSGFDVRLLAVDPRGVDGRVEETDLADLLGRSQVVSLHAPLTAETRGLIGERELSLMRRDAVLVNTARGGLVDQEALIQALELGTICGAGLDVFEEEPLRDAALTRMSQVVLSPHTAGLSVRSIDEMVERATRQVLRILSGNAEPNVVNPEALRHPKFERPVLDGTTDGMDEWLAR
jgi:phosphoglycerate dehydrogenase-like enzyme